MPQYGSAIITNRIPIIGLMPEQGSTAPASPVSGLLWNDTSVTPNVVKYWNGSAWIRANGADLPNGSITDNHIAAGAAIQLSKLATDPLARGNHTGTQLAATISDFATAVRLNRLDQMALPTSPLDFNGQRGTNGATPTSSSDLATKQYVDDRAAGIAGVKDPVRVAAQTNVNLAAPGANIDSTAMVAGDRFLAPAQTTTAEKGIWIWNGAAVAATRAADVNAAGEILDGTIVAVSEGTDAGKQYMQTATPSGAPGAWSQVWTIYNTSGSTYLGGAGLVLSGSTFNVQAADGSIVVNADDISVGLVPIAKGGTGATTAAAARTALGTQGRYAADLGALTAGVYSNVTHSLGTTDINKPSFKLVSTGEFIELDSKVVDANTVGVKADIAYGSGAVRIVVMG